MASFCSGAFCAMFFVVLMTRAYGEPPHGIGWVLAFGLLAVISSVVAAAKKSA